MATRRQVIAGLVSAGVIGAGGYLTFSDSTGDHVESVEIDSLSRQKGGFTVPEKGEVTLIDFFATWCSPCKKQLEVLKRVRGDLGSVSYVSVTNQMVGGELSRRDVSEWWSEYGGDWRVGFDDGGRLTRRLGADGLPYTVLVDREGVVVWRHRGVASRRDLKEAVDEV